MNRYDIALGRKLLTFETYPKCPKCGMGLIRFSEDGKKGPRECVNGQCDYVEPDERSPDDQSI